MVVFTVENLRNSVSIVDLCLIINKKRELGVSAADFTV